MTDQRIPSDSERERNEHPRAREREREMYCSCTHCITKRVDAEKCISGIYVCNTFVCVRMCRHIYTYMCMHVYT